MALADRFKTLFKQGEGAIASNKGKAHQAVDKAAAEADKRTKGKYSDQIRKAEQKADEAVDDMREPEPSGTHDRMGEHGATGTEHPQRPQGGGGTAG